MPRFILSYRSAKEYDALTDPGGLPAWGKFLNEVIAPNVVDPGWPVFEPSTVIGEAGPSTQLGGYSIVTADDLETAVSMARSCPTIERGGGVEVGVLADLPQEHPAEQMRSRLAGA
jgi:YCII-related domain